MSTRSLIAGIQPDKTIKSIYCHFDGYLDGVGKKLYENYMDPVKVNELLALGDMSSLQPDILQCSPYTGTSAESSKSKKNLVGIGSRMGVNFIYLFNGDYWSSYNMYSNTHRKRWRKLTNTLVAPPPRRP
jgi:hypothetical protein